LPLAMVGSAGSTSKIDGTMYPGSRSLNRERSTVSSQVLPSPGTM